MIANIFTTNWFKLDPISGTTFTNTTQGIPLSNPGDIDIVALTATLTNNQVVTSSDTVDVVLYKKISIDADTSVFVKIAEKTLTVGTVDKFTGLKSGVYVITGSTETNPVYVSFDNNHVAFKPLPASSSNTAHTMIDPSVNYVISPLATELTGKLL